MRVLLAGCGYLGLALGTRLVTGGHTVHGFRRAGGDPTPLVAAGIAPIQADLTLPSTLENLEDTPWDAVVLCAAPEEGTEAAYRALYLEGTRNVVEWFLRPGGRPPGRLIFTGSTAVYGQTDGSAVNETSPTEPADFGGRILLEAESLLAHRVRPTFPATVLRVAGIYGPRRNRLAAFRQGQSRIRPDGQRWMNLIHREDLVSALHAVITAVAPGPVYNVSDGAPPSEAEFHAWMSARIGPTASPCSTQGHAKPPTPSATRRPRVNTHKRVLNQRLRDELGWRPSFPDFRAGYENLIASGE